MKEFRGKLEEGPMKRLPTLAMVGGRCLMFTIQGGGVELFSSEGSFFFQRGVGCGRCFGFKRIRILCDVAKGRANDVQSPSLDLRSKRGKSDHETTPCGPPHGHGILDCPGQLQHLLLLGLVDLQAVSSQLQQLRLVFLML